MPINITARHTEATPEIQAYVRRKAEMILEEFPRVEHIHVVLDVEKHRRIAEFVVQGRNHIRVEALESSKDMAASIDAAVEKIEKQLRKLRDKVQDHKVVMKKAATQNLSGMAGE